MDLIREFEVPEQLRSALKVEFKDSAHGRVTTALRSIDAGALVFREDAFVSCLSFAQQASRCHACWNAIGASASASAKSVSRCSACQYARYCSRSCQLKAWPQHKRECACLAAYKSRPADQQPSRTPTVLLMAKLLFARGRVLEDRTDKPSSERQGYEGFRRLVSNISAVPESKKELYGQMTHLTRMFIGHDAAVAAKRAKESAAAAADAKVGEQKGEAATVGDGDSDSGASLAEIVLARSKDNQQRSDSESKLMVSKPCLADMDAAVAKEGPIDVDVEARFIFEMFATFSCNNFTICDAELKPVGIGIFPLVAMANHSCNPNCVVLFDGPQAQMRAIRRINKGEDITVSYIDLAASRASRRAELLANYFFACDCAACTDMSPEAIEHDAGLELLACSSSTGKAAASKEALKESKRAPARCTGTLRPIQSAAKPASTDSKEVKGESKSAEVKEVESAAAGSSADSGVSSAPASVGGSSKPAPAPLCCSVCKAELTLAESQQRQSSLAQAREWLQSAAELKQSGDLASARALLTDALARLDGVVHARHLSRFRALNELAMIAVDLKDWPAAARHFEASLPLHEQAYPRGHPLIGLQYLLHGQVSWFLERTDAAVLSFSRALEILAVSHGRAHELVRDVDGRLREALAEQEHRRGQGQGEGDADDDGGLSIAPMRSMHAASSGSGSSVKIEEVLD